MSDEKTNASASFEMADNIPFVSDEHMKAVEQGIAEADAGLARPMTNDDWSQLRKLAHTVANAAKRAV